MRNLFMLLFCGMLLAALHDRLGAQQLVTRNVVTGLDTPWEVIWGPDGWIWCTERPGRVSRVNPETGEKKLLVTISDVVENSESGLLGMALHPNFADTPHVFVVYTYSDGGIREKLVRYTYDGTALTSPVTLLSGILGNSTHDGSRLVITPDRKILMTVGDAQDQPAAQSHTRLNGKILRMNLDGTAPDDNPWGNASAPANLLWSTGHRNPQGLVLVDDVLYSSEHGPNNDDEINIIRQGRNYGWPNVHGYCDRANETQICQDSNVVEPIKAWTPTLAVAGLDYYRSDAIPEWKNHLLLVTLKEQDLRVIELNASGDGFVSEKVMFDGAYGRLRDLCIAPDGRVFIATSNRDGRGAPAAVDDRIIEVKAQTQVSAVDREDSPSDAVRLYPLPARERVAVELDLDHPGSVRTELVDAHGATIYSVVGAGSRGVYHCEIPLQGVAAGPYFIVVRSGDREWRRKLVKE